MAYPATSPKYDAQVAAQIDQYADVEDMHADIPDILNYWKEKHLHPRFAEVFPDVHNHYELYWKHIAPRVLSTGCQNIVSLGCGDASVEVGVARGFREMGLPGFRFYAIELSPIQLARAKRNIEDAGLTENFTLIEGDINKWIPDRQFAGAMAHHSLHHVQDLEHLFSSVKRALHPNGVFCTYDVIGRNGHMRWPEALAVIEKIWSFLPQKKRYNQQWKEFNQQFLNLDCSVEGFEGIRAQDILPLLVKSFEFEQFFAWGGLTDAFINRGYGANFSAADELDCAFIDFVQYLNEILIDLGYLKPTELCAVMSLSSERPTRIYKDWSPEFCIRSTGA